MGEYEETVPDKTGKCCVCGTQTHDRTVTTHYLTGKVEYRTWRCGDFEACKDRRQAKRKRKPRPTSPDRKAA